MIVLCCLMLKMRRWIPLGNGRTRRINDDVYDVTKNVREATNNTFEANLYLYIYCICHGSQIAVDDSEGVTSQLR